MLHTFFQSMTQRYLSLPNMRSVKQAAWISNICGRILCNLVAVYVGLLMYATFYDCDPITTKVAKGRDQIVPLFVMKTLGQYPGLPGIFVAGVFSAALSTVSSALNAMSAVVLEDFCKTLIKKPLTERQKIIIMKSVVIIFGVFAGSLAIFMDRLGTVLQMTLTIGTIIDGPSLGMFVMGLFLPWVKIQGVLAGGSAGLAFILWIVMGAQASVVTGRLRDQYKHLSVEGCPSDLLRNTTLATPTSHNNSDVFYLYRLSYCWNVPLSCVVTVVVGLVVTFFTGANDIRTVDRKLLSPAIRKYVPKGNLNTDDIATNGYKPVDLQIIPKDMGIDGSANQVLLNEEKSL
ncbi:sodium-coupled monocarboxylate transporter 1 [Anabrus simplex]|uniref:sodium-coupled monocarboxylate transporter 1 n=1 Tax=Anabrus simplex TaxID=316456 RepID=UPI0035A3AA1E